LTEEPAEIYVSTLEELKKKDLREPLKERF